MERKRVLIDMDHVMADITSQYIEYYKNATGVEIERKNLLGKPEDLAFPESHLVNKFLHTPGFFRTAHVIEGSQEVIRELNGLYEIYIVSAAMEFSQSLIEKYDWLQEHFPFITWQQMIFCGSKKPITGDFMIDDHFRNLKTFNGEKLLFTATHNIYTEIKGYTRVNDWKEVKELLIPISVIKEQEVAVTP